MYRNIMIKMYKDSNLPFVLYECETLKEEHMLRILRIGSELGLFVSKKDGASGG
jgi:hypothetical protein